MENWFSVREVGPRTWAIDDHGQDTIYLVEGEEEALLIDTGWGIGNLPPLVRSLTDLPLIVVHSHGHPDHVLGDGQFPEVLIGAADLPIALGCWDAHRRRQMASTFIVEMAPPGFDVAAWPTGEPKLVPIEEGHVFDLGRRCLESIALPGHSSGGLCFLDAVNRQLFTGDSILTGPIWMQLQESLPLREFQANLKRVQARSDEFDVLLPDHGITPLSKQALPNLIAGIEEILAGRLVGRPESTFAGDGLRCDFELCSLLYNPDKLG